MMKAAYEYYQQTHKTTRKVNNTVTLGSLDAGTTARVSTKRPARKPRPKLTHEEQALMNLINSGQIGALIAFHAPAADL